MNNPIIGILLYSIFLLVAGFLVPFVRKIRLARGIGWTLAGVTIWVATQLTVMYAPLSRMLVIVFLQLLSMKILVCVETYRGENGLKPFQWVAFAIAWFGMRPKLFESFRSEALAYSAVLVKGLTRIVFGFLLLYASMLIERATESSLFFLPQLFALAGLSLILHFGLLNLSTAWWRSMGVDVHELFRSPYKSGSLKEFWGKRWNIAFSEMTALIAYRPLKNTIGTEKAIIISFLLSGLLHEFAISLPVKSGYGQPMLYFFIHAVAMQLEARSAMIKRVTSHPFTSHVWVMTVLILPLPLLFHHAFVNDVLMPLRDLILGVVI